MIQAYSLDIEVPISAAIPFNNTTLRKGCTTTHNSVGTFDLNKCGVYCVMFNGSSETDATVQLFVDGVPYAQAQSTGMNPCFHCLVPVNHDNSCCACDSPVTLEVRNIGEAEVTLDANIVITKLV